MSNTDDYKSIKNQIKGKIFTFNEACEIQKKFNKDLRTGEDLYWINVTTGRRIEIGSNY